jgi:hypothetical protein
VSRAATGTVMMHAPASRAKIAKSGRRPSRTTEREDLTDRVCHVVRPVSEGHATAGSNPEHFETLARRSR